MVYTKLPTDNDCSTECRLQSNRVGIIFWPHRGRWLSRAAATTEPLFQVPPADETVSCFCACASTSVCMFSTQYTLHITHRHTVRSAVQSDCTDYRVCRRTAFFGRPLERYIYDIFYYVRCATRVVTVPSSVVVIVLPTFLSARYCCCYLLLLLLIFCFYLLPRLIDKRTRTFRLWRSPENR